MFPPSNSLILVTVLPSPRDLDIVRLLGWYRIPLRKAPKVIAVDYLAFYQTAAFEENKWQIETVASVRGHELLTRAELLSDEPHHPRRNEEYYKIQLGALETLDHPIIADKWKRITFLYTTGEYLSHARTINDLVVHSEERKTLWHALREREMQTSPYQAGAGSLPEIDLDPLMLAALLGIGKQG
ncbi:MAG: hypothetical protein WCI88_14625 [Chloroflexota bacterium]